METETQQQTPPQYQKKPLLQSEPQELSHYTIGNTEWGLVIGALAMADLIQVVLDLFGIGVAINRFLDMFVGASFTLYVKIRCKHISFGKSVMRTLITFIGEEIPVVDALPFWTLDGFYNMGLERAGERLKHAQNKIPGGKLVMGAKNIKDDKEREKKDEEGKEKGSGSKQQLQNINDSRKNPIQNKNIPATGASAALQNTPNIKNDRKKETGDDLERKILQQSKNFGTGSNQTPRERLEQYKQDHADEGLDDEKSSSPTDQEQEGNLVLDKNSISEAGPIIGSDIPTTPDKVYRQVQGIGTIEDIHDSGVVRSSTSASKDRKIEGTNSKGSNQVYWTRGKEGKSHTLPKGAYVIEAPYEVAKERLVKKDDITAIYTKKEDGSVSNLLNNLKELQKQITEQEVDFIKNPGRKEPREPEKNKDRVQYTKDRFNLSKQPSEDYGGIELQGSEEFREKMKVAMNYLYLAKDKFEFAQKYIKRIQEGEHSGLNVQKDKPTFEVGDLWKKESSIYLGSGIAHEAYHSYLWENSLERDPVKAFSGKEAEKKCIGFQIETLYDMLDSDFVKSEQDDQDEIQECIQSLKYQMINPTHQDIPYEERNW